MCQTATLVFASDEKSEAEILDSAVNFPLSDGETDVVMRKVKQPGRDSRNLSGGML